MTLGWVWIDSKTKGGSYTWISIFIAILFRLNSQNWNLGTKSPGSHSGSCCEAPNQRRSRRKLPWTPRYRRIECFAQNIGAIQFRFYSTDFRVNSSFQDNTFKCHPSDPYWFLGLPKAFPMVSKPHPTGKETIRHQISVFIEKRVPILLSELERAAGWAAGHHETTESMGNDCETSWLSETRWGFRLKHCGSLGWHFNLLSCNAQFKPKSVE